MASYTPAKRATALIFYAGLPSQATPGAFQSTPTLAAGDFKVSIDGGALANLATLPTVTPASGKMVKFSLSSSEMTGDNITVVCSDAAGAEWFDVIMNIQTSARQFDDLAFPATSGRSMVVDASGLVDANTVKIGPTGSGTAQTARDVGLSVLLSSGSSTGQLDFTSGVVKANATQWLGGTIPAVNVTGVPIVDDKYLLGTIYSTPATAGIQDVNVKNMNNVAATAVTTIKAVQGLTTADTIATYTGNTKQTADVAALITTVGVAGVGLTNLGDTRIANLDAAISSRSTLTQTQVTGGAYSIQSSSAVLGDARIANLDATVSSRGTSTLTQTQVTGGAYSIQSASAVLGDARIANLDATVSSRTKPADTQAAVTTVTNLTNAPTAGDFTATMKTSLNAATPAVTVSDKTGFSLTSAYDPAKTAAQAGDAMTLTAAYDAAKTAASATNLATANTGIAAIKVKTDSLTFTQAGQVDSNIHFVNDVQVKGVGSDADPWNPA